MYQFVSGTTKYSAAALSSCLRPKMINESLVLLGNNFELYGAGLSRSKNLLEHISKTWPKVYVIPGETEICGNGLRSWIRNIDELTDFLQSAPKNNVALLNNSEIHDGDNILIGSTFWAGAPHNDQVIRRHPQLVRKYLDSWSQEDAAFIGNAIRMSSCQNKKLAIATYYGYKSIKEEVADSLFDSITGIAGTRNSRESCQMMLKTIESVKGGWVSGKI